MSDEQHQTQDDSLPLFGGIHVSKEAMYRAMVEQSLDALLVLDGEFFVDCNASAEKLYGGTRDQLTLVTPAYLSPPRQPNGDDSIIKGREYIRLANEGKPQRFEWMAKRFDGHVFPTEVYLSRLVDDGSIRTIISVRDLSARKNAEAEARRRNARFRTVLDSFPGGICLLDETGHVFANNENWCQVLALPYDFFTVKTRHVSEIFEHNVLRDEYREFGNTVEERRRGFMAFIERKSSYSYERTRYDGAIIEIRSAPVSTGGWVTTCHDVTESRAIQREYKRQSILLNAVLSNMPQAISVYDTDLKLQVWNQGLLEMFDFTTEHVKKDQDFVELMRVSASRGEFDDRDAEQHILEQEAFLRRFEAHQFERTRKNGRTHLIQGKPIYEEDQLSGLVTSYTDITHLKNVERALEKANAELEINVAKRTEELNTALQDLIRSEKMAALGSLVAGVSHELNTPIGNSLLISSTLNVHVHEVQSLFEQGQMRKSDLQKFLDETNRAMVLLERSLNSAADLITSFKQVAVDQASSKRRYFNLHQAIGDILATLMAKIRQAGVQVHLQVDANIDMDSYPGPIEQVISNLIDNAILHGFANRDNGEITIHASALDEEHVEIRCSDNGIGIPEQDLSRVFDPFFTTKLGKGGSGLGLNIVYNIVTSLLGGKIHIESAPNQGACFVLRLPKIAPISEDGEAND